MKCVDYCKVGDFNGVHDTATNTIDHIYVISAMYEQSDSYE